MRKKKQSQHRNDDTRYMNEVWRQAEEARTARSREIRDREQRARERARAEVWNLLSFNFWGRYE
jgi:hypothetical protein